MWTPIGLAIAQKNEELVHLLIKNGAELDSTCAFLVKNQIPLACAVFHDQTEILKMLLEAGADETLEFASGWDVVVLSLFSMLKIF